MKNKLKTYILLLAVLGIWGLIAYKIFSSLNPSSPEVQMEQKIVAFKPPPPSKLDTFTIKKLDRDPFLGTVYKKKTNTSSQNHRPKSDIVWPHISYGGVVRKQGSTERVYVVDINQQQFLIKKGQSINEVQLLSGNAQEAQFRFQNEKKTFPIQ